MKYSRKKIIAVSFIILFFFVILTPIIGGEYKSNKIPISISFNNNNKEIDLLRVEHYLYLNAEDNTNDFNVRYVFPPDYQYQVPILLEILDDSTADILDYKINDDSNKPNKIVNFTIGSMQNGDSVLIHFSCWVLVKNHKFDDIPNYIKIPTKNDLPNDTLIWLLSTDVVQAKSLIIRYKATQLRGISDDLISFAKNISTFIKEHRSLLFFIQYKLGVFFSQDALTTLFISGENVGRSHLASALLRSNNIPSRVLLVNNDQGFWTQMHYMIEYFCPNYGWVLMDSTEGKTPYDTKRQVVNRVCYPEDEEDTKVDYIFPLMKGEERWIWIDSENVFPYYKDCDKGSKSQMFTESEIITDWFIVDYAFFRTKTVFHQYEKYLSIELTGENLEYQQNAISYQKKAIDELKENDDIIEYIYFLDKAYDEYKKINIK